MAFYPLLIPVFLAAGYDAVVGISVILLGAGAGVIASTVNPFATGIAAGFAGVSLGEGIVLRLLEWVAFEVAAIWFVMAYAAKVKKNPSKSVVGVGAGKIQVSMDQQVPFTAKRKVIMALFTLTFLIMVYAVVPFDTFEQYLGPRYENIPGVEYILENGTLLYFMEEAPGVYESADHTVTGATDKPKLYVPVYDGDELQPSSFAEVGAREQFAAITDFTVTMGLPGVNQRQEPGFVLDNGLVLLESERDSQGNYKAGAGMDGMFLQTGRVFAPIRYDGGEIIAFVEQPPAREREQEQAKAPEPEKPARVNQGYTILESVDAGGVEFVLGENPKAVQPFVTWRRVDGGGPTDFTWGHYYNDYQSAKRDLMGRAQEQLNDQNEGKPPSLRAKLRMAQENKSLPGPHRPAPEKER